MIYIRPNERYCPMHVVYAHEEPPTTYSKSIFLAGPTPRNQAVKSWRPRALKLLAKHGYDGVVFVPEDRPDENGATTFHGDYDGQVDWEDRYLNMADCILFWVPRDIDTMPAFTTNDEWGFWKNSGKTVFGAPRTAPKCRYQIIYADKLNVPFATSLAATVQNAIGFIGYGAARRDGERYVPLYVWQTPAFQQWYKAQRGVGNELSGAQVLWTFHVGPRREHLFLWAMQVDVYVASEDRHKTNEFVIARPDISTIVAYRKGRSIDMAEIALVREFRSPASNPTAFVWETPGGSTFKPGFSPEALAAEEFYEETGIHLSPERFVFHEARQLASTLSAHQAHLFSVELTADEIEAFKSDHGNAHGVEDDTERTYVEVLTLGEIRKGTFVDWSVLGMIMHVLLRPE